ncbi:threonine--tRNA ligase [Candidatus Pacearchaeota archaeon]|nr:MAG: threonine--tRNA ligase [Candidatus Pacearchaeota archaeon]
MKTLNLHCDYIHFKALKKALKSIEEIAPNQNLEGGSENCLVVLVAVEKGDNSEVVEEFSKSVIEIARNVKTKKIVLYPYAHLSSNLASPTRAVKILSEAREKLKDFEIISAPFGYYKEFELKVKGHPLAELSREIHGNEEEAEILEEERERILREITKSKLDTSKLMENDHRIIGAKMDLWSFNSAAPGMVFLHDRGLYIKNKLIEYWRKIHREEGYIEISTPQVLDRRLWEVSGHWRLYKENMFTTKYENRDFAIKPMNCPGGMLVYKSSPKSYRDFPLRVSELGIVHRLELSGVLSGLFRVIQFMQDDAHIFCTGEQLHKEIVGVLKIFQRMIRDFHFSDYRFTISTRGENKKEKYLGDDKTWAWAEKTLEKGVKELGVKFEEMKGEAKFYGPSLDVHIKDSQGREWQCSTLQLDFALPKRFNLKYKDSDGNEKTPFMLHRAVFGSLERFMGIITEHFEGKFPMWISPNQIKVLTLNDEVIDYANEVYKKLFDEGFRVEIDTRSETMGRKVRDAQIQKFNYLVTIGEKEKKASKIAVRKRDSKKIEEMDVDSFIENLKKEIREMK